MAVAYVNPDSMKAVLVWPLSVKFTWNMVDDLDEVIEGQDINVKVYYKKESAAEWTYAGSTTDNEFTILITLSEFYEAAFEVNDYRYSHVEMIPLVFGIFISCNQLAYNVGMTV